MTTGEASGGEERGNDSGSPYETVIGGRYQLRARMGRGGMSMVWDAYDVSLGRPVVVKELTPVGDPEPEAYTRWLGRLRREVRVLASTLHRHLAAIYDLGESDGRVWIVMERLDQRSLADRIGDRGGRLDVPETARIGLEVLRGLRALYAAGVAHGDVKPHNILFRPDGPAVLVDQLGLTFADEGGVVGTPAYMAPERFTSPSSPATAEAMLKADLWSLGVTLYEAVEGHAPFQGLTVGEVMSAVRGTPTPPMGYAGALRPLIEGLLVKDPERRLTADEAEALPPGRTVRLRRISRLTVEGLRPSSAAIARTVAFSRSRSAMWIRSASRRYLDGPSGGVPEGFGDAPDGSIGRAATVPPDAARPLRHRLPVRTLMPTIRAASAYPTP